MAENQGLSRPNVIPVKLDPKAKALLTAIAAAGAPSIAEIPYDFAREQVEQGYASMKIPVKTVGAVEDIKMEGPGGELRIRIYTPFGEGPFPVMVFFHGGGWVLFSLEAYDPICSHLCDSAGCIVASVDYRLSPENKFPAAIDDCLAAARWISDNCAVWNGNPGKMILAGDSAGGTLATVTAMRIRDEGGPNIKGQVILYPVTDYIVPEKPSYVEFAEGYSLTINAMKWFWDKYLDKEEDARNPYAAPLLASDLSGLPPALVIISGYDPLRDEGLAYAKRLAEAGVPVQMSFYGDMIHGFLSYLGILKHAITVVNEISVWIKKL
jgi:acetyl esterase